jgi:hypothetical protein
MPFALSGASGGCSNDNLIMLMNLSAELFYRFVIPSRFLARNLLLFSSDYAQQEV